MKTNISLLYLIILCELCVYGNWNTVGPKIKKNPGKKTREMKLINFTEFFMGIFWRNKNEIREIDIFDFTSFLPRSF